MVNKAEYIITMSTSHAMPYLYLFS